MKGDFTKQTFRPANHYTSVRMQQGRVQTDADWNEQSDILAYFQSLMAQDLFGQSGAPQGSTGFRIDAVRNGPTLTDFTITAGRYYVNGAVCENETPISLLSQPDFPAPTGTQPFFATPGVYLVYLDVWPRHITALEDPSIREPALGGVDTGTRVRNTWQVKTKALSSISGATQDVANVRQWNSAKPALLTEYTNFIAAPNGLLSAGLDPGAQQFDNRLYRVEVHSNANGLLCVKWSRDNGSMVFRYSFVSDTSVTVGGVAIDSEGGLAIGQIVELTDDARELRGDPGVLMQITNIASQVGIGLSLTLAPVSTTPALTQPTLSSLNLSRTTCKLRRWDGVQVVSPLPTAGAPAKVALEFGLFVQLHGGTYRPHDYWQIPTRTDLGVDWPLLQDGTASKQTPHGIAHGYAPLAVLQIDVANQLARGVDCRILFPALSDTASAAALATLQTTVTDNLTGLPAHEQRLNNLSSSLTSLSTSFGTLNTAVTDSNTGLARHEARINTLATQVDNLQEDLAATGAVTGSVRVNAVFFRLLTNDTHRFPELREYGVVIKTNCQTYFGPPKVDIFQNPPQVSMAVSRLQAFSNVGPMSFQPVQDIMGFPLLTKPNNEDGTVDNTVFSGVWAGANELSVRQTSQTNDGFQFTVVKERIMRVDTIYGGYTAVGRVRSIIGIAATTSPDGGVDLFVSTRLRDLRQMNRRTDFTSNPTGPWNVISGIYSEFWGPPAVVYASSSCYSVIALGASGRLLESYRLNGAGSFSWQQVDHDPRRVDTMAPDTPMLQNQTPDIATLSNPNYDGNTFVEQNDVSNPGTAPTKPYRFVVASPRANWDYVNDPIVAIDGGEYNSHTSARRGQMFTYSTTGKLVYTTWSNDTTRIGQIGNLVEFPRFAKPFTSFHRNFMAQPENAAFGTGNPVPLTPQGAGPRHAYGTMLFPYRRGGQNNWIIAELRPLTAGWTYSPNVITPTWNTTDVPSMTQVAVYADSDAINRRFLIAAAGGLFEYTLPQAEGNKMRGVTVPNGTWHTWTQGPNLATQVGGPGAIIAKVALAISRTATTTIPVWYGNSGTYTLPIQPALPCSAFCVDTSGNIWEAILSSPGVWTWRSYGALPGTKPGCDPTATLMPQPSNTFVAVGYIAGQNGHVFELRNGQITDLGRPY